MSVFADLNPPYSTIVADPPWSYAGSTYNGRTSPWRSTSAQTYSLMSIEDVAAMPVGEIAAPDAHLYLWAVNPLMHRAFEVVHTPGHSPGGIGLFERKTGTFLSGDVIYDGPLIDDAYHSDVPTYVETLDRLRELPVSVVHGGHFPSFGAVRFRQLIEEYVTGHRKPGCHLGG